MVNTWYKEGLYFGCTQCGKCCTGSPSYVFIDDDDIERLALALELDEETFLSKYTRRVGKNISLLETAPHYDCILLKDGLTCSVYNARPKQCATFPFWPQNIKSKDTWLDAKKECEGIDNKDGNYFSAEEILNFFSQ